MCIKAIAAGSQQTYTARNCLLREEMQFPFSKRHKIYSLSHGNQPFSNACEQGTAQRKRSIPYWCSVVRSKKDELPEAISWKEWAPGQGVGNGCCIRFSMEPSISSESILSFPNFSLLEKCQSCYCFPYGQNMWKTYMSLFTPSFIWFSSHLGTGRCVFLYLLCCLVGQLVLIKIVFVHRASLHYSVVYNFLKPRAEFGSQFSETISKTNLG